MLLTHLVKIAHPVCVKERQGAPGEITEDSAWRLFLQEHAEEAAIDRQRATGVVDKAKLLELVHEMADPRTGGAHHLRQVLLIDAGKDRLGSTFLAKVSE